MRDRHYNLFQSFAFAFQGIFTALKSERNLRIHCCTAPYVFYFSRYYSLSRTEYAILILTIGLVITCELFNTAIEKTVDLKTSVYVPLARIAKDVAAGAVLVSSIASLLVGILFFWEPLIIKIIIQDIGDFLWVWIPLFIVTLVIIFLPSYLPKSDRP